MVIEIEREIGRRIQELMEKELHVNAEEVAHEARRLGLPWSRATVAGVISGRRRLNLGELLVLTELLARAAHLERPILVEALLPAAEERVDIGGLLISGRSLRGLLHGSFVDPSDLKPVMAPERIQRRVSSRKVDDLTPQMLEDVARRLGVPFDVVMRDAAGEAEAKAALRLGTLPELVAIAAHTKWGRSLTSERDEVAAAIGKETTWGVRGHLTRDLETKLDDHLRRARVELIKRLRPAETQPSLLVREAEEDVPRRLAARLRTLSELVVLKAHQRWSVSAQEELRRRMDQQPGPADKDVLRQTVKEMAEELRDVD